MSDISLNFGPLDWLIAALYFGWPGLILGAVLGALISARAQKRRLPGAAIGAVLGCLAIALIRLLLL